MRGELRLEGTFLVVRELQRRRVRQGKVLLGILKMLSPREDTLRV